MYKLGDEKGEILEKEIAKMDAPPKNALELGTFLGYSALRTARRLAPGGMLHCIGVCVCERARERKIERVVVWGWAWALVWVWTWAWAWAWTCMCVPAFV